jgi:hypothetical protein
MRPAVHNIEIYRGDTFEIFFRVRTKVFNEIDQEWEPGPYKVLTGWTGLAQIRASADAVSIDATLTVTLSNQTTTPGGVLCRLTPTETAALSITAGVWDVQLTDGTDTFTYITGSVAVVKDVARA